MSFVYAFRNVWNSWKCLEKSFFIFAFCSTAFSYFCLCKYGIIKVSDPKFTMSVENEALLNLYIMIQVPLTIVALSFSFVLIGQFLLFHINPIRPGNYIVSSKEGEPTEFIFNGYNQTELKPWVRLDTQEAFYTIPIAYDKCTRK